VRTFSRDELRSLFRVDPGTPCDTHKAIKCGCDGSARAAAAKAKDVAASALAAAASAAGGGGVAGSSGGGGGGGGGGGDQGVSAWAHLADAADSPDPTWQVVSSFTREKFVTYVFSDHTLADPGVPPVAGAAARGAKRPRGGGNKGAEEEGEEAAAEEGQGSETIKADEAEDKEEEEVQSQPTPARGVRSR
jgi:hypothetical protein